VYGSRPGPEPAPPQPSWFNRAADPSTPDPAPTGPAGAQGYAATGPDHARAHPPTGPYGASHAAAASFPGASEPPAPDAPMPAADRAPGGTANGAPGSTRFRGRRGLVIGLIVAAILLIIAGTGVVVTLAATGGGDMYKVGSCVKQDGTTAQLTKCSEANAYKVTDKVDSAASCADQNQPYVVLEGKGSKNQVLCLRPANAK
jgi:hypothetical protein